MAEENADELGRVSRGSPPAADTPGDRSPPPSVLGIDHVYAALAHPRRRYLCYTLLTRDRRSTPLAEVATRIAAWEDGVDEGAVTADRRDAVYVSLYHHHVPKLVDEGVITLDDDGPIAPAEHAEQVLRALEGIGASLDTAQERHARRGNDVGET